MTEVNIQEPRFMFPQRVMEKFNLTKSDMLVLTHQHFPLASPDTILLALTICKHRGIPWHLRPIEVMPFNSKVDGQWIKKDQLVLGLNWWRYVAQKSGAWMGNKPTEFGETIERTYPGYAKKGAQVGEDVLIRVAEWAQVTIQKMVNGVICEFSGPRTYWDEYVRTAFGGSLLPLHKDKPNFVLEKTAEVAALRRAFGFDEKSEEIILQDATLEASPHLENPNVNSQVAAETAAATVGYQQQADEAPDEAEAPPPAGKSKSGRGRPKGSKNAPKKAAPAAEKPQDAPDQAQGQPRMAPAPPAGQEAVGEPPPDDEGAEGAEGGEPPPWLK